MENRQSKLVDSVIRLLQTRDRLPPSPQTKSPPSRESFWLFQHPHRHVDQHHQIPLTIKLTLRSLQQLSGFQCLAAHTRFFTAQSHQAATNTQKGNLRPILFYCDPIYFYLSRKTAQRKRLS